MLSSTVIIVLNMIEAILPLVTGAQSASTVTAIDKIIQTLEAMLPQIVSWSQTMYSVISNIISSLQNSGNLTPTQISATQALGAQVDAAWNNVVGQIDPDNPANAGTLAGDPGTTT